MKRLLSRIDPRRHLMARLWLQLTAVVIAIAAVLMLVLQLVLGSYIFDRSLEQASNSASLAGTALSSGWQQMLSGFVSAFGT